MMPEPNPILITGAHRSGTTWVGKIIANSPFIHYIHEPFNIDNKIYKVKPNHWFQYITRENENFIYEHIKGLVTPRPLPRERKSIKQRVKFFKLSPPRQRVLVKDPIAIFSTEWFASRFNMDVVIMIRHPAAFVESIRERNWTHDFNHFLDQPLLMEGLLFPFKEEILRFTKKKYDIIDQAILLWKLIYYMVSKYREKHDDWLYVRHEDLSVDPGNGFKRIFNYLNITFSKKMRKIIEEHSNYTNPIDGDVNSIKRNSKAIVKKWKNKFTAKEIKKIRDRVENISGKFYSNEDW
jgi:hypothetical protein